MISPTAVAEPVESASPTMVSAQQLAEEEGLSFAGTPGPGNSEGGDRLIVDVLEEEETTTSGIVLPDTAKEKPQRGKVLAVGPGSRNDEGQIIPIEIAEGDEIIFSKYGGTEVKLGSDDVLILRESDVLAKVIGTREPAGAAA